MRNAKNILLHEIVGLRCTVTNAKNKTQIGISGAVEDETMKTVTINGSKVFKEGSTFRMMIDGKAVDIEGDYILGRPEDRIKKKMKKW